MKITQIRAKTSARYIYILWVVLFLFIGASQAEPFDTFVKCYYMYPAYYQLYKKPVLTWLFNTDNNGRQKVYNFTDRKDMIITNSSLKDKELIGLEVYGTIFRPHRMRSACEIKDVAWTLEKSNLKDMKGRNKICRQFEDDIINVPNIQFWTMERSGLHRSIDLFCIAKRLPKNATAENSYVEADEEIEVASLRRNDSCSLNKDLTEEEDDLVTGEQCALNSKSSSTASSSSSASSDLAKISNGQ